MGNHRNVRGNESHPPIQTATALDLVSLPIWDENFQVGRKEQQQRINETLYTYLYPEGTSTSCHRTPPKRKLSKGCLDINIATAISGAWAVLLASVGASREWSA
jgi:hypothetical protein